MRFRRMKSAIENGRLIRERNTISLKIPVREVVIVDKEKQALEDFLAVQDYIKEELNCVDVRTESNEKEYVVYKAEADNRVIGGALKKEFNKDFKKKLAALTSEELQGFLEGKDITINGHKLEQDWIRIEKTFTDKYNKSKEYGCATTAESAVMIKTVIDDELREVGTSREIVNRVQKLRKAEGVQIDDEIEVYFEHESGAKIMQSVVSNHGDKIQKAIRKPFLPVTMKPENIQIIGTTEYEFLPEGAPKGTLPEVLTLYVCNSAPHVNTEALASTGVDP